MEDTGISGGGFWDLDPQGHRIKPLPDVCVDFTSPVFGVGHSVYIPSRGRAVTATTPRLMLQCGVPFKLVVEPDEVSEYSAQYGVDSVLSLPDEDQGVAFARNWIKRYSIQMGESHHWQIDDNIRRFAIRKNGKNIDYPAHEALSRIERCVEQYDNVGICSPSHSCFAFAAQSMVALNRQVYSCVLVNNSVGVWWRDDCVEDTDYSLQILKSGYCTILFSCVLMDKATTMSMGGGNTEIEYSGDGRERRSDGLMRLWPGFFKKTTQYGRSKILPSQVWSEFRQRPRRKIINR